MAADIPPPPAQATLKQETQRNRMPAWAWALIAAVTIPIAVLAFVTAVYWAPNSSQPSPASTTTSAADQPDPAPEPTVTEQPVAAPITLPDCETLWPERYAVAKAYAENYPSEILYDDIGDYRFADRFGPAAQAALSQAAQVRSCVYLTNSETFIQTSTTELKGASKEALLAALRADADFVESTIDGAQVFEWRKYDNGHWEYAITTHTFLGDVWIAGFGPQPATDYVPQLLGSILAANPTLQ